MQYLYLMKEPLAFKYNTFSERYAPTAGMPYRPKPVGPTGHGVHRPGRCTKWIFGHTGEGQVDPTCMLIYRPASAPHSLSTTIRNSFTYSRYQINSPVDVITAPQIDTLWATWYIGCRGVANTERLGPFAFPWGWNYASLHLSLISDLFFDRKQW